ncbi:RES family NAD+ phosphorylase [Clostridium tyrobutyricum]|uniref:RES family NAD+ phosphorylase n=1 Tax=Clostridium tyrobutyricum TaxID=1519 RepID=UPI001C3834CF|nr:RES family NAD+ phosphorylase [Clostridium tyrobutyricum]MBV4447452.1 RES family NAD+ phosphorylase [Clostridium tyrobutyricum]
MGDNIPGEIIVISISQFNELWDSLKEELMEKRFFLDPQKDVFKYYISRLNNPQYLKSDEIYYRSRINDTGEPFISICNSLNAPPKDRCNSGRLNGKGIRYLYLSNDIKTSVSEVRPWIGSIVEVAKFKVRNDNDTLIIKDFLPMVKKSIINSIKNSNIPKNEKDSALRNALVENRLKKAISRKFSQPVSGNKSELEYLVTQCITEYIRDYDKTFNGKSYDGIRYASSVNEDGYNILIFNPDKMEPIDDELAARVKINKHEIDYPNLEYNFE